MRALGELLGAYGVKYFCRKMMSQIVGQVDEIKVFELRFDLNGKTKI